jgi:excisionase family DNA binding protein
MNTKMLSTKQVQEIFGVHLNTLYKWIHQGKIKAIKVSRKYFFQEEDIKKLLSGEK